MNRYFAAIALSGALIFAQGCSQIKSGEARAQTGEASERSAIAQGNDHSGHDNSQMCHANGHCASSPASSGQSAGDGHGNHSHGASASAAPTTQAKLTVPPKITPNKPVPLAIEIQDKDGKAIANFEMFQEKLMHLIVVSDDLQVFKHLHPEYKEKGRFEVETAFPKPGNYSLFVDYKPAGQPERISMLKASVTGTASPVPAADTTFAKTFGDTKVKLDLSEPTIKAGEEVMLVFGLQDAKTNKSVTDLQPYLGEQGHLVIVRQSPDLTASDYIHAHAHAGAPAGEIHFMTQFPQPGKYKLWGQFQRNGQIVTADFWVNVQ